MVLLLCFNQTSEKTGVPGLNCINLFHFPAKTGNLFVKLLKKTGHQYLTTILIAELMLIIILSVYLHLLH